METDAEIIDESSSARPRQDGAVLREHRLTERGHFRREGPAGLSQGLKTDLPPEAQREALAHRPADRIKDE
jgi:hypothetical protein